MVVYCSIFSFNIIVLENIFCYACEQDSIAKNYLSHNKNCSASNFECIIEYFNYF